MDVLPGGVMSAVQLHTLSVDLAASLTDTMTNPSPSTPRSWHAVTFPTYAAVRRTMTDRACTSGQQMSESAVKSLPLRSLPAPPCTSNRPPTSTEARAYSWRSLDRSDDSQRSLRPRPRSTRHHSSADGALPRPKPTRPRPSPASSFTSTPAVPLNSAPIRRRFADREDAPTLDDNPVVRAANSMPARAFSAKNTRWDDSKRGTAAGTVVNNGVKSCSSNNVNAPGIGRVPRTAGGDGEDCPAAYAFAAERLVRTEGPQLFRRAEILRGVPCKDRNDKRTDSCVYSDSAFRRGGHGSPTRKLQAPIAVKAKMSPASSGMVASPASSGSSSRESSAGYGRLGVKTAATGTLPTVADIVKDDGAPPLGLAGTLGKRGRFTHRLVQRHFVLEGTKLSNYRTKEDVKPSWQRSIQGAHVITKERSHQIIIAIGKKRVILFAANGEDTRDWADALGRAAYGGVDTDTRGYRYAADVDLETGRSSAGDRSWAARLHSTKVAADRAAYADWNGLYESSERRVHSEGRRRQSELRGRHGLDGNSGLFKNGVNASVGGTTPNAVIANPLYSSSG